MTFGKSGPRPASNSPLRVNQVVYVLAYRAPDYIRSQSLLRALGSCADIELLVARNRSKGMTRYLETWRALRQLRNSHAPDIYLLGFRGHEIFWPVRWLTRGKPLVFDALMSPSTALSEENAGGLLGRLIGPLLYRFERRILQRADLVLTDTQLHAAFYVAKFGLPRDKVLAIPVGAMETHASTDSPIPHAIANKSFSVLFYGSMLALHGVEIVIAAAAQLVDLPIRFDFIGGSAKQARRLRRLFASQGITRYTYRRWVPLQDLVSMEIPAADLCLGGPFGGTPQARRVVTSKTSQGLALGKATVIGATEELCGFVDRQNCLLVPQADVRALANALRWAYENRATLPELGAAGQRLYAARLSVAAIAQTLNPAMQRLCSSDQLASNQTVP